VPRRLHVRALVSSGCCGRQPEADEGKIKVGREGRIAAWIVLSHARSAALDLQ